MLFQLSLSLAAEKERAYYQTPAVVSRNPGILIPMLHPSAMISAPGSPQGGPLEVLVFPLPNIVDMRCAIDRVVRSGGSRGGQ